MSCSSSSCSSTLTPSESGYGSSVSSGSTGSTSNHSSTHPPTHPNTYNPPSNYTQIDPSSHWTSSYYNCNANKKQEDDIPLFNFASGNSSYNSLAGYCNYSDANNGSIEFSSLAATTDRTRWACPNLAVVPPPSDRFYRFLNTPMQLENLPKVPIDSNSAMSYNFSSQPNPQNITFLAPNFHHLFDNSNDNNNSGNQHNNNSTGGMNTRNYPSPSPSVSFDTTDKTVDPSSKATTMDLPNLSSYPSPSPTVIEKFSSFSSNESLDNLYSPSSSSSLLPIMDYRHNLREIVKNSILLEDHIIHPEKRCGDCCTKHFLCLEALAEEAKTLDTDGDMQSDPDLYYLPDFYRNCARDWYHMYNNPSTQEKDYTPVVQRLRQFRKKYQQQYFPMGWNASNVSTPTSSSSCSTGACPNSTF